MIEKLTDTEKQIARLLSQGMTARDIGKVLGYHEDTISNSLRNIYRKLGLRDGCKAAKLSVMYVKEKNNL